MQILGIIAFAVIGGYALVWLIDVITTREVYGPVADQATADKLADLLEIAIRNDKLTVSGLVSIYHAGYFSKVHGMAPYRQYAYNSYPGTGQAIRIPRSHVLHGMLEDLLKPGRQSMRTIVERDIKKLKEALL